jgi:anti-repressor protein
MSWSDRLTQPTAQGTAQQAKPAIPTVEVIDGKPVTTSRQVAEFFGKEHKHVLRDIEQILAQVPENSGKPNFGLSEYEVPAGGGVRKQPMYLMDKDGFTLLVMGYTGADAMCFKIAYIRRFNEMEEILRGALPEARDESPEAVIARAVILAEATIKRIEAERKALEGQVTEYRPLAGFAKAVQASEDTILIKQLAGFLKQNGVNIGQNRLFEYMRGHGYLCKERGENWNKPTQRGMDLKLFEVKESVTMNPDGTTRIFCTTKVTGKGQLYFLEKFGVTAKQVQALQTDFQKRRAPQDLTESKYPIQ